MQMFKDLLSLAACTVVVFFVFAHQTYSQEMDYSLVTSQGIQCPGRHSCVEGTINRNFSLRNCECDNRCNTYDDCCIDSDSRSSRPRYLNAKPLYRCVEDRKSRPSSGIYVISKCRNDWNGPAYIRENCESDRDNMTDPILAAPATDSVRRKTYRNLYCAECNDVDASSLKPWEVMISCNLNTATEITDDYIKNNLEFSGETGTWGVNYRNDSLDTSKFHPCQVGFGLPQSVEERQVRRCRPDVISTCPKSYRRQNIRRLCSEYMAVVYTSRGTYRNPHCVVCNGISLSSMKCFQTDLLVTERKTTPMSFTLLFDVNSRDGSQVGSRNRCPDGQSWDVFFEKCRSIVCILPGRTLVNGRCVSQ